MPRHAIHACRCLLLQRKVGRIERFRRDVVQQRSELLLRLPRCCLPYPLRRLCHARPALCPVRALASRIPLGSGPSLRRLRRDRGPFVRRPHRYYGQIRLLQPVHHRFGLSPLFRGPGTTVGVDWSPLRSPAWTYVRAWVLRRRGALAPSRKRALSIAFGRRSIALPARAATDTSHDTSRCPAHGSRWKRFVTPFLPPDSHRLSTSELA